jgi:hypothetical protein
MRLFRVDGEWPDLRPMRSQEREEFLQQQGLLVEHGAEGPGVYLGAGATKVLGLCPALAAPFEKEPDVPARLLLAGRLREECPNELGVPHPEELELRSRTGYYGPVLMHIALHYTEGGRVWFEASTYDEVLDRPEKGCPRVRRVYHPLERAVGVKVLALAHHEALLWLWPGAGLRACRDEETLPLGASPVLQVTHGGKYPRVFAPESQKRMAQRQRPNRTKTVEAAYCQLPD